MSTSFLFICTCSSCICNSAPLQVMKSEPVFRFDISIGNRQRDKSLPRRVETGLAKRPAVTSHDDETL